MAQGFTLSLTDLQEVADQCLPDIDLNLGSAGSALNNIETDQNAAFDDPAATPQILDFAPADAVTGGLYLDLRHSFTSLGNELVNVIHNLRTNIQLSEMALRHIHDRYAAADGQ